MPVVTVATLLFGELLAGAVLTEQIFTIPGFGKLIVDAVFNRDYAVVQGVVLCTAIGYIGLNLLADVLYVVLNPAPEDALMTLALDTATAHASAAPAQPRAGASSCATAPRWSAAIVVLLFALIATLGPLILPLGSGEARRGRPSARRRRSCTGSARTNSGATCSRAWSTARRPR